MQWITASDAYPMITFQYQIKLAYCMFKKSWLISYRKLPYDTGQAFSDIQYLLKDRIFKAQALFRISAKW